MTAETILRRLVEWFDDIHGQCHPDECEMERDEIEPYVNEARAFLAKEKVYAEGWVNVHKRMDVHGQGIWHGEWTLGVCYQANKPESVKVRIPVPAHLLHPETIEGEVIPDGE